MSQGSLHVIQPGTRQPARGLLAAVLILICAYANSACGPIPKAQGSKGEPARLEKIEGSDLKRVIMTAKAAERIGLQTTPVREEQIRRTRTIGGEVVALPTGTVADAEANGAAGPTSVRMRLSSSELSKVDRNQPALVLRRSAANATARTLTARLDASPVGDGGPVAEVIYTLNETDHGLALRERVLVKLPLVGGPQLRKLVPYSALLYDLKGVTWAYTQVAPLSFVRAAVTVDFVEGQLAILSDGPAAGTLVVTVGATELFGTEVTVGK